MAWIESDQSIISHPKTYRLAQLMGWDIDRVIAKLHRLWWWCLEHAEDGDLSVFPKEVLASAVGLDGKEGPRWAQALAASGWADAEPALRLHGWWDRIGIYLQRKYTREPEIWKAVRDRYSEPAGTEKALKLSSRGAECSPKTVAQHACSITANIQQTATQQSSNIQQTCIKQSGCCLPPIPKPKHIPVPKPTALTDTLGGNSSKTRETARLVEGYKALKSIKSGGWDRANSERALKAAALVLEAFGGNLDAAGRWLCKFAAKMEEAGRNWTLETAARHAWEAAESKNRQEA